MPDEQDAHADRAIASLEGSPGLAPPLWQHEMRNLVLMAVRRNRIPVESVATHIAAFMALPIQLDAESDLDAALALALRHGLSYYDALYLELACRRGAALATLDRKLWTAAQAEGVAWE